LNVQNQQIFSSDFDLQVRVISNLPVEEKILFINNVYFGELAHVNDNMYTIRIQKSALNVGDNELSIRIRDLNLNILEKVVNVVIQ